MASSTWPFKLLEFGLYFPVCHAPPTSFYCRWICEGPLHNKKDWTNFFRIDQVHEQNNRSVKIDGGAIELLDNKQVLLGVGSICALHSQHSLQCGKYIQHESSWRERMTPSRKILGRNGFHSSKFQDIWHPFMESQPDLINIVSKEVMSEKAAE